MMLRSGRHLALDLSWIASGYIARTMAYLGLTVVLARVLGPEEFGQLALFLAAGLGLSHLAGSWPFLAVPVLGVDSALTMPAFFAALRVALTVFGASALVALPVAVSTSQSAAEIGLVMAYALVLIFLHGVYSVFQTKGRMAAIALTQTVERTLALTAVALVATVGSLSLLEVELILTITAAVAMVSALAAIRCQMGRAPQSAGQPLSFRVITRAVGLMAIVSLCSYAVAWIDIWVLAAFHPDDEVGRYALAYQVFTFVLQLGALWIVVALPEHARRASAGQGGAPHVASARSAAALWAGGVAALAIVAYGSFETVFGARFSDAREPLMLLLVGAALLAPYFAAVPILLTSHRTKVLAAASVAGLVCNAGLDLALVPSLGAMGPAVATTVQGLVVVLWVAGVYFGRGILRSIVLSSIAPALVPAALLLLDPSPLTLVGLLILTLTVTALSAPSIRLSRPVSSASAP